MTWLQRYRIRHYIRNSIWILPVLGMVAALAAVPLLHGMEEALGWKSAINPETARAVLGTLAASMFTFIVFVCSALLVAVQLASAQLTPRIIAIVFRDPVTKFSLNGVRVHLHLFPCGPGPYQHLCAARLPRGWPRTVAWPAWASFSVPDRPRGQVGCVPAGPCGPWPGWDAKSSKMSIRGV